MTKLRENKQKDSAIPYHPLAHDDISRPAGAFPTDLECFIEPAFRFPKLTSSTAAVNYAVLKAIYSAAAARLVASLRSDARLQGIPANRFDRLQTELAADTQRDIAGIASASRAPSQPPLLAARRESLAALEARIAGTLGPASMAVQELLLQDCLRREIGLFLNRQQWNTIERKIDSPFADREKQRQVRSVPLNQGFDTAFSPSAHFSHYRWTGCCPASRRFENSDPLSLGRLVNGWFTEYLHESGRPLLHFFRGGCIRPGPATVARKARLALGRRILRELLSAMALRRISSLPVATQEQVLKAQRPLCLRIVVLDLQTLADPNRCPGSWRPDVEGLRFEASLVKSLDLWQGNLDLRVCDQKDRKALLTLPVHTETAHFCVPVEEEFFRDPQVLCSNELSRHNRAALARLGAWMTEPKRSCMPPAHQRGEPCGATAAKLACMEEQVREIQRLGLVKQPLGDPYKLASRIANLAFLLDGVDIFVNCLGGKDRTSMLAAESMLLAERLHAAFDLGLRRFSPDYRRPLHPEERSLLSALCLHSGQLEIQRHNTGAPGYCLAPISCSKDSRAEGTMIDSDPFAGRIGSRLWKEFRGLADFVQG